MKWNLYIWQKIDCITDRYHDEGGVAVIAKDEDEARELVEEKRKQILTEEGYEKHNITSIEGGGIALYFPDKKRGEIQAIGPPDAAYPLKGEHNSGIIFIFPDAGCC
jgi:hypothetical protein